MQILELLIELVLFFYYEVEYVITEELLPKHERIIMWKKPHQIKLLLLLIPYQYLIPGALLLLTKLSALDEILVNHRSEIDLALEGIVLDLLVELVKGAAQGVLKETLFCDDCLWVQLVINVQPTWFAVHVRFWVYIVFELL